MTAKRYGLTYDNQIFDNLISDPITNERAVELLNNSLKRINALHEENKNLKQTIKEAYQSERTMIGKSELKQLMETIQ